ncbi:ABC transporter ATP-binding protein [Lentibacillus sediminis]|uniref:ABC transporter ATP-binding protein n=1 Tax=Lentibacillus sediminis TaxID=1940529 RepID=UPI000C1C5DCD|nr:ABC transporter ATP-binding protein [Lentibacillus sediminis]
MILKVEDIQKSYKKERVLETISFEIHKPQILALIGPNGSGKSTLLNIITNLLHADHGGVTILGKNNTDPTIFKEISFMQDTSVLYDYLTGYDHLQFIADAQALPKTRIEETAQRIGNAPYLNKRVKNYSLGMKQHLLLAMAVINRPKLLILDEPLNGLDPTSAIRIRELLLQLEKEGTAILLSSHNLGEIDRVTSNILFLKNGRLIKEELSLFELVHYFITVDQPSLAMKTLEKHQMPITIENHQLKFPDKDRLLHNVLEILQAHDIEILGIEQRKTGSEQRYRKIFADKDDPHAAFQV